MIGFAQPEALWLLAPWLLFCLWFGRLQRRALGWVDGHVAARFRHRFTVHGRRSLTLHVLLLLAMGALLVVAAARPTLPDELAARPAGRVLLVVDGSASMYASDVALARPDGSPAESRLEVARLVAAGLLDELEGYRFALVSFSGTAAIHLPMVADRRLLDDTLATLEPHAFYRNTGSSFVAALDAASHFIDREARDLQVVVLSDGEMPVAEEYGEPLEALARQGVPIHAVAIGTPEGQGRVIYDFRDVIAGKENKRVLREYTTRRVDEHLQRMARESGGRFLVMAGASDGGTAAELAAAIRERQARGARVRDDALRREIGWLPVAVFLALFLADRLLIGRRRGGPTPRFELDRITRRRAARPAPGAALLLLCLGALACARTPERLAHRENEHGIRRDAALRHAAARPHYERAIGLGVRPQVPTYNLARSVTLAGDYAEAHEIYQRALELDPELVEAYYNDGVALYRWGAAERDPRNCDLERTRDLWTQSRRRFATAQTRAKAGTETSERARRNLRHLAEQLAEIERLQREPPPECQGEGEGGEPPPGGDGSGGGGASGGQGGEPGQPPPAGGGLTPEESEGIAGELERIAAQAREAGKYHRRTLPEQMRQEDWESPEAVLWW